MPIRLLNAKTYQLEYFVGSAPDYAILSHLWGPDEATLQEIQNNHDWYQDIPIRPGLMKIKNCCIKAFQDGYSYVWVDTCCIDKTSSAELQEAINSMVRWYTRARVCYAYISDVTEDVTDARGMASFRGSRWFRRGWTLQELIAPGQVQFFRADWSSIGTKFELRETIAQITGIPVSVLQGLLLFEHVSIAQRMSWASSRETTVEEDIAYCLMGLFGVSMPLLYGEGRVNAFKRLQYEILAESDDETIFAWEGEGLNSMIAWGPECFSRCGEISGPPGRRFIFDQERPPYSMTNKGLRIEPLLIEAKHFDQFYQIDGELAAVTRAWPSGKLRSVFLLPLNCILQTNQKVIVIALDEGFQIQSSIGQMFRVSKQLLAVDMTELEKFPKSRRCIYVKPAFGQQAIQMATKSFEGRPEYF